MVKKKVYLRLKRGEGEGYLGYPSPHCGLGLTQSFKQYIIDTTDFGLDQGDNSVSVWEDVSMVSAGAMSSVWTCKAMGSWICIGVF